MSTTLFITVDMAKDEQIEAMFDFSQMDNNVEFNGDNVTLQKYKNDWGDAEFKGFFRHLANSIRKRCRDFGWHTQLSAFEFSHSFMPGFKHKAWKCTVKAKIMASANA